MFSICVTMVDFVNVVKNFIRRDFMFVLYGRYREVQWRLSKDELFRDVPTK